MAPMIGAMGLATESASWFFVQRAAQNAADAAVLAAASNGSATAAPTYVQEALAVAAKYGFVNGAANATVTAVDNVACPSPSTLTNCYKVTVTKKTPIALTTLVGYTGDTTVNGDPAVLISASAIASMPIMANDCLVALAHGGTSVEGFRLNGGGNAFDAHGCALYSKGTVTCNGSDGDFGASYTPSIPSKPCENPQTAPAYDDTYYSSVLQSNPLTGCPSKTLQVGANDWSGLPCVTLTNPSVASGKTSTITTNIAGVNKGTVVVVNGNLTVDGVLSAAVGQGLTFVFTATSGVPGFVTASNGSHGTLDFGAPTSGPWSGIALYQNPALTTTPNNINYGGNNPTVNITGLVYAPYAKMTFKGDIHFETGGLACMSIIADTMLVSGNVSLVDGATRQCAEAGVSHLPTTNVVAVRQALVQ
jgi:hypothetical protein